MAVINKQDAETIAKKLGAEIDARAKAHDVAKIFHNGVFVASFGIRRGSRKDQSHDHVPAMLHISPHQAREIAVCREYKDFWIRILESKRLL